jgi:hypothetical protein
VYGPYIKLPRLFRVGSIPVFQYALKMPSGRSETAAIAAIHVVIIVVAVVCCCFLRLVVRVWSAPPSCSSLSLEFYCIVLYCIVLCCIVLHCVALQYNMHCRLARRAGMACHVPARQSVRRLARRGGMEREDRQVGCKAIIVLVLVLVLVGVRRAIKPTAVGARARSRPLVASIVLWVDSPS